MLKFFACYIWLILGFLTAFMILLSTNRILQNFPIPLITMLVWMTGELDYAGILYPKTENIHLVRDRSDIIDYKSNKTNQRNYIGYSRKSDDYLQFAGIYKTSISYFQIHILFLQALPICSLLATSSCSPLWSWTSWLAWQSVTSELWWRLPGGNR